MIDEVMETMSSFQQLVKDLDTQWKTPESRIIGHIVYSPPVSTGEKPNDFTMDWALYRVDPSKIKNFAGNIIDLGHDVSDDKLNQALNPNIQNPYNFFFRNLPAVNGRLETSAFLLMRLGIPKYLTKNNSPALSVVKRGKTTGGDMRRFQ